MNAIAVMCYQGMEQTSDFIEDFAGGMGAG